MRNSLLEKRRDELTGITPINSKNERLVQKNMSSKMVAHFPEGKPRSQHMKYIMFLMDQTSLAS
jgi:hypothetical protein